MAEILLENKNQLSADKQEILNSLLERPSADTSIVSPSGIFRIHYFLSGNNAPKYNVHNLAEAFDSAYNYEVNFLGFPPPPKDESEGGDDKYDIYIQSLGPGSYGETRFSINSDGKFVSYTLVDNSFSATPTEGIDGAIVTAAHEFHHAIQVGNYGWFSDQTYFYEITSTSMEEFVFDDINDYYYYLPAYFRRPSNAFSNYTGYELAHWNIFLKEKFEKTGSNLVSGFDIIRRSWELFASSRNGIQAYSQALFENGTSFKNEFLDFGLWCYFTSSRKDSKHFSEAENYPKLKPLSTYPFSSPNKQYMFGTLPISNNFIYFNSVPLQSDTLVSVLSNCDVKNSMSPENKIDLEYNLYDYEEPGSVRIINQYYSKINSVANDLISQGNIYNNEIVSGNNFAQETEDYAFPQPFAYSEYDFIYIPAYKADNGLAELKIYSVDMKLIFNSVLPVQSNDKVFVKWNAKDNSGNKLATGVYIYVTKSGNKISKGKFAILNDD